MTATPARSHQANDWHTFFPESVPIIVTKNAETQASMSAQWERNYGGPLVSRHFVRLPGGSRGSGGSSEVAFSTGRRRDSSFIEAEEEWANLNGRRRLGTEDFISVRHMMETTEGFVF
jgi:hypothetical protein